MSPPEVEFLAGPFPMGDASSSSDQLKRKLEGNDADAQSKRPKTLGPFVMDEDDDEEEGLYNPLDATFQNTFYPLSQSQSQSQSQPQLYDSTLTTSSFSLPTRSGATPTFQQSTQPTLLPIREEPRREKYSIRTCSGKSLSTTERKPTPTSTYEQIIAGRSTTAPGRAQKSYYGIDIHTLLDVIAAEDQSAKLKPPEPVLQPSIERPVGSKSSNPLWTEKYRARKFIDLIGDDRTHRSVLHWLKAWDDIVFPGLSKTKTKRSANNAAEGRSHRKILMLAGPPGLGKTTLAHVCARQAGYEVMEINASDERSSHVVKGRIRDAVGTENVKSIAVDSSGKRDQKANRPACVVIDEVDGVVTGSGGGEGGFIKALIDLVNLDKRNTDGNTAEHAPTTTRRKKKTDKFRLLRPLILICNDIYHPSLRPLRTSSLAEIIHVRHPPLEKVVARMKSIFHNEGIPFDTDGVRRLCEASWGLTGVKDRAANSRGVGEGDIRAIMVAGEWIAHKLRADGLMGSAKLTKRWVDRQFLNDSARDSSNLGRGGSREVVERVFLDGAGFATASLPKDTFQDPYDRTLEAGAGTGMKVGVADLRKRHAMTKLGQMIDAAGDHDRCITDCFTRYPTHHYQDDTFLTKPSAAYDWLDFHDHMSFRVHASQAWELSKYLSLPVLAFHHLFASASTRNLEKTRGEEEEEDDHPFAGPRADFAAYEAMKQHHATLTEFQASMSPSVLRTFRSLDVIATELVPNVNRMLSPDIKPTLVGGAGKPGIASVRKESEKALLRSATRVMAGLGIDFERVRVEREGAHDGWAYRMEPPLDTLNDFHMPKGVQTDTDAAPATVRYAVRQALAQERHKETLKRTTEAGQAKLAGPKAGPEKDARPRGSLADRLNGPKRDFFGRVVAEPDPKATQEDEQERRKASERKAAGRVGLAHAWIAYHEGFSNAVRKRITMQELFMGL